MADQDDEITVTPEMEADYAARMEATTAMYSLDKLVAGSPDGFVMQHLTQQGCVVIPSLATELILMEVADEVCIGVPRKHALWLNVWPFSAIIATENELFFVSREYEWLNTSISPLGVSTGPLQPSVLLSRLTNQKDVKFFEVDDPLNIKMARPLRRGATTLMFHSHPEVAILKTREYRLQASKREATSENAVVEKYFL